MFGSLVRMLAISRFTRTLATLLKSGVPLLTAMDIVKNVITNACSPTWWRRPATRSARARASPRRSSARASSRRSCYHMIAIGERSGQLEDMLLSSPTATRTR